MPIIIGLGVLFAILWVVGSFMNSKGIAGSIANIIYWLYRRIWIILLILIVLGILIGFQFKIFSILWGIKEKVI